MRQGYRPLFVTSSTFFSKFVKRNLASGKTSEPLRVLFCGSDEFSIASLKALCSEQRRNPESIASIDVVCRPGKLVGRGLKSVREVPIVATATELSLALHQIETFTGWNPPQPKGEPINLIVAVSFGLLVPPRILRGAKYGGVNIHPSILPDFRGPAPLHHALLSGCTSTGITLQTLHPKHFDHGTILAQERFQIPHPESITIPEMIDLAGSKGAAVLTKGIRDQIFVPPVQDISLSPNNEGTAFVRPAPKITPKDRQIDWKGWNADEILRKHRIIGPLWNLARSRDGIEKRVIWPSGFLRASLPVSSESIGLQSLVTNGSVDTAIYIRACDGQVLMASDAKVEGSQVRPARDFVARFASLT